MSAERELLRRLRSALRDADVDAAALVAEVREEAEAEVRATLKRAVVNDLLERVLDVVEASGPRSVRHDEPRSGAHEEEPAPRPDPTHEAEPGGGTESASAGSSQATGTATYVFGITSVSIDALGGELPALPSGGAIRAVDHGQLRAVVCDVDPRIFAELAGDDVDVEVLASAATAHDSVLARCAELGPVVPLRLGTVVVDDTVVRELLQRHEQALAAELDRFDGVAEWAVTVQLLHDTAPGVSESAPSDTSDGRSYMELQRAVQRSRRTGREERARVVTDIHRGLESLAEAATTVQHSGGSSTTRAHHGIYLLQDAHVEAFDEQVQQLRRSHPQAVIEVSGPWPPYHFTTVTLDDG